MNTKRPGDPTTLVVTRVRGGVSTSAVPTLVGQITSTPGDGYSAADVLRVLGERKFSESTQDTYRRSLAAFAEFVGRADGADALDWLLSIGPVNATSVVSRWDMAMAARGLAAATRALRLAALRSLWTIAKDLRLAPFPLIVKGPTPTPLRDTSGPGVEGVRRMRAAALARGALREVVLLGLLAACALRRSEALRCVVGDFDAARSRLKIVGKGEDDATWVALPPGLAESLRRYVAARAAAPGEPLLVTHDRRARGQPRPLTGSGLDRIVRALGVAAGVDRPVSAHRLRHTGVTAALDETGGDVRRVQRYSRHRKLETVMIYDDRRTDAAGEVATMVEAAIDGATDPARRAHVGGSDPRERETPATSRSKRAETSVTATKPHASAGELASRETQPESAGPAAGRRGRG